MAATLLSTVTATEFVTTTVTRTIASASASSSARVAPQGGVFDGENPTLYNASNPIILFIIQAGIIIIFCRLLHWPLSWLRQPRVIAEVIGGIILGPTVMGRIPGFTTTIFPTASMANLNLVANLGLVLFLFLVGLEVDIRYFASNWRPAASVGLAGMALPFGLGCAIAWGLFNEFHNEPGTKPIAFGIYMLFIGVAMAITAFPVLCRILTELKLIHTPVGTIVLSAGVGNDILGWVLLALCVALVNAGSGITALWVLLTCIAWVLFLAFAVRPAFMWVLRRTHSLEDGPSQSVIVLTLLIALTSAFFTGVIGVHPIFGAFLAGLICPHEGGFAIKVTEKIEDLVSAMFLPLYFALSGLSTNLGLLNNGITWAYVIGVIAVAFCGKFIGGTLAAKLNGMVWRESFTIGALMSCKGLVELIVLNIGLQAKILSQRTFTIFVVMALVTTFATTPLTMALYPPWYQRKLEAWKRGEIDWDTGNPTYPDGLADGGARGAGREGVREMRNLLVYLRLDSMHAMLSLVSLLGRKPTEIAAGVHPSLRDTTNEKSLEVTATAESLHDTPERPVQLHGMRLVELTERTSTVMKVAEIESYTLLDPVLSAFRMLGQLFNLSVSGEVVVVPESSYADTLAGRAVEEAMDLLLLPWSETGTLSEHGALLPLDGTTVRRNTLHDGAAYTGFVAEVMETAQCATAVFINSSNATTTVPSAAAVPPLRRNTSGLSMQSYRGDGFALSSAGGLRESHQHIFMPFFGLDQDESAALQLVLQFAENPTVTATIVHFTVSAPIKGGAVAQEQALGVFDAPFSFSRRRNTISAVSTGSGDDDHDDVDDGGIDEIAAPVITDATPISNNLSSAPAAFFHSVKASLKPLLAARILMTEHVVPLSSSQSAPTSPHAHAHLLDAALVRAGDEFRAHHACRHLLRSHPSGPVSPPNPASSGLVVLGRNLNFSSSSHALAAAAPAIPAAETQSPAPPHTSSTSLPATPAHGGLGAVADAFWSAGVAESMLVVRAARGT